MGLSCLLLCFLVLGFLCFSFFFFFFQAEDGIRDRDVTGVQTCALPISARDGGPAPLRQKRLSGLAQPLELGDPRQPLQGRSEERRVGKECRSRWSAYH